MENLKIAIAGAGIGGLTAGIALTRAGYEVEIYDRVSELRPVGAGISLWSNGVKVLNHLGLGDGMAEIGGRMERMEYRDAQGQLLNAIDLMPLIERVGQRPYPVARRDLQQLLLEAFPGPVHLNHECIGAEEDESGVTVKFENGRGVRADLLVAADGVRSRLRTQVMGTEVLPQYGGYVNWNGLVRADASLTPPTTWTIYVGNHQRASMMPVARDRLYFFFDVPLPKGTPAHPETYRDELRQHFQGWAEPVRTLIERLDPATVARPEIHDVGPLERFARGRICLLGDAAHATCPDLGQGGCQAMEDGWVLANVLKSAKSGVEAALQEYEGQRRDRANAVVRKARQRAEQIHGKDPQVTQRWYEQLAREKPADVTGAIAKIILAGPLG